MTINFKNKKALIRVDFNVPLDAQFNVTDNTRILAALPTIKKVLEDGGSAILMSHLGRPKDGPTDKYSLKHLLPELNRVLGMQVKFVDAETGEVIVGSGLGEAKTVKMSTILDDVDEIKFNQSTIGSSTKKALETASSRVVVKLIKKGLFKN